MNGYIIRYKRLENEWNPMKKMSWIVGSYLKVIISKEKMNFLPNKIIGKSLDN